MAIEDLRVLAQQIDQRESAVHAREDALRMEFLTLFARVRGNAEGLPKPLYEGLSSSLTDRGTVVERRAEACQQWAALLETLRTYLQQAENETSLAHLRKHLADSLSTGVPGLSAEMIEHVVQTTIAEVTDGHSIPSVTPPDSAASTEPEPPKEPDPLLGDALEAAIFDDFGLMEFEFSGGDEGQPTKPDHGPADQIDGSFKSFWTLPAIQEEDVGSLADEAFGDQPALSAEETSFADLDGIDLDLELNMLIQENDEAPTETELDQPTVDVDEVASAGFVDPFATIPGGLPASMEAEAPVDFGTESVDGEEPVQEFVDSLVAALAQFEGGSEDDAEEQSRPSSQAPREVVSDRLDESIGDSELDAAFDILTDSEAEARIATATVSTVPEIQDSANEADATRERGHNAALIVPSDVPVVADDIEYGAVMAGVDGFEVTEGSAIAHFAALAGVGDPDLDPWAVLDITDARGGISLGPLPSIEYVINTPGPAQPSDDPQETGHADFDEDCDASLLDLSIDEILDDDYDSRAEVLATAAGEDPARRQRAPLGVKVGLEYGAQFFTGFSKNISIKGIFITTEHALPIEERVHLFFELPGGHPVAVIAEVRWRRPGSGIAQEAGVGLEFVNLDHDSEILIERHVALQGVESKRLSFEDD